MVKSPAERQRDRRKRLREQRKVDLRVPISEQEREAFKSTAEHYEMSLQDWAVDALKSKSRA